MPDLLELTPHPDEQRSLSELRREFRLAHHQALLDQMLSHPVGWAVIGPSSKARDRYTAEEWSFEMLHHLDAPCSQDFALDSVPVEMWDRLARLAHDSLLHESVTWDDSVEGVVDHDAPPCSDVRTMTDVQLCEYVDAAIRESENG